MMMLASDCESSHRILSDRTWSRQVETPGLGARTSQETNRADDLAGPGEPPAAGDGEVEDGSGTARSRPSARGNTREAGLTKRVLHVADGLGKEAQAGFLSRFPLEQRARVSVVAMDMHEPYIAAVRDTRPDGANKLAFDAGSTPTL